MSTKSHLDELSPYAARPWRALYEANQEGGVPKASNIVSIFKKSVRSAAAQPAVIYFDQKISYAELDASSDAFATALADEGFGQGSGSRYIFKTLLRLSSLRSRPGSWAGSLSPSIR